MEIESDTVLIQNRLRSPKSTASLHEDWPSLLPKKIMTGFGVILTLFYMVFCLQEVISFVEIYGKKVFTISSKRILPFLGRREGGRRGIVW